MGSRFLSVHVVRCSAYVRPGGGGGAEEMSADRKVCAFLFRLLDLFALIIGSGWPSSFCFFFLWIGLFFAFW